MDSMWETGNGGNDIIMTGITPKNNFWNSNESLNKSTTDMESSEGPVSRFGFFCYDAKNDLRFSLSTDKRV